MLSKILVIEDQDELREDILEILMLNDFDTAEADDVKTGIQMIQQEIPNLIICDISMPGGSGYDILHFVRNDANLSETPFIFLTAKVDREFIRQGMELGADDYITKPFSHEELLSAIKVRFDRYKRLTTVNMSQLDNAKTRLTRLVTHELKTPLVSISMVEQIISRQIDSLSKSDITDLMDTLRSGSSRLQHLVEQMLLMTQLESLTLTADKIQRQGHVLELWMIIEAALESARQFAHRNPQGNVRLNNKSIIIPVYCDYMILRHAVAEIIANALDFSPKNGAVTIGQVRHHDFAWITITDEGPGISTDHLKQALLPFEQVNRDKQEQQGMGLGLPLAKRLIELHQGDIIFRKTASHGTQVIIQLPLHNREQL